jgi:putative phosphoserine phosphatase/1-acylglycerol-3-phosphate O-acyltransferase
MARTSLNDSQRDTGYIAFFDLDRTLIGKVSGKALATGAWKKGLMKTSDLVKAVLLSLLYSLKLMDPVKVMNEMLTWVEGISESTFNDLCSEVFTGVLLPSVYGEAKPEIEEHHKNKTKTVILSSSLLQVCREFADHLGIDDVICSEIEIRNGILTGKPKGHLCFGPEKLVRMKEYCEKNNITPRKAWYYADSASDIPVLEAVGHPVCVNPDKELLKKAKINSWEVYYWK